MKKLSSTKAELKKSLSICKLTAHDIYQSFYNGFKVRGDIIKKNYFSNNNPFFTLIMSTSSEKDIRVAFEKLAINHSDTNANINISHFKRKILEAFDHLKGISHKRPDVYSKFDFIARANACTITKEALADTITDLVKQNITINKKSFNGRDSFRRNTLEVFSTTDETSDTDNTQLQNEKGHKDNNKPNSFLQQPTHSFIETDTHTLCSCQQLASEITKDSTSLNTITETSSTVPTDIQTPITVNNLNDTKS